MVYLDYAATTPMMDEVIEAMLPYQQQFFGNPSSVYGAGREAKKGLEEARERVADAIGAQPSEIVFTAGGTEADNLALKGAIAKADPRRRHIITTSIEHHAVLHSAEWLERQGYRVTFLPVDGNGLVNLNALKAALSPETAIVSVMLANNEVGTIQPLREVVDLVKEHSRALVHTDAVQGLGKIPVDVEASTWQRLPHTSSAARRAWARCTCGARPPSLPSYTAAARSGSCAAEPPTSPESSGLAWPRRSRPPRSPSRATGSGRSGTACRPGSSKRFLGSRSTPPGRPGCPGP
jgi:cysteine sulfinate desulfinase/cysteine desulfurase-like protein